MQLKFWKAELKKEKWHMRIKICKIFPSLKWEKGYIKSYWGSHFKHQRPRPEINLTSLWWKIEKKVKKKKDLTLYKESIKLVYSFFLVYKGIVHRHSFLCLKSLTISANANVNLIERSKVCETAQYSQPFRAHLIVPACTSLSYV